MWWAPTGTPAATGIRRGSRRIFEQQASWEGRRWPPLSARTEEQKGSARIGVETGRLRRSLTERPVVVASRRRLLIGTRVPYAARFDQRRPVLYADPDVLAEAVLDALLPKDRGER